MKARIWRYSNCFHAFIIDIDNAELPLRIYSDKFSHSPLLRKTYYNRAFWLSRNQIKYQNNFIQLNEMQE